MLFSCKYSCLCHFPYPFFPLTFFSLCSLLSPRRHAVQLSCRTLPSHDNCASPLSVSPRSCDIIARDEYPSNGRRKGKKIFFFFFFFFLFSFFLSDPFPGKPLVPIASNCHLPPLRVKYSFSTQYHTKCFRLPLERSYSHVLCKNHRPYVRQTPNP